MHLREAKTQDCPNAMQQDRPNSSSDAPESTTALGGEKILVIGHLNPDTDSAVAAHVYAQLRNRIDSENTYEGVVLGPINDQTAWLFRQSNTPFPREIDNIEPTVGTVISRSAPTMGLSDTLGTAMDAIARQGASSIPVLSGDGKLEGLLSDRIPECNYFHSFNTEDFLGILFTLDDLVHTFQLECWQAPTQTADGSLTLDPSHCDSGDVLLTGDTQSNLQLAAEKKAAAAIICSHRPATDWADAIASVPSLGVYHYQGSLMALSSQLPHCIPAENVMSRYFTCLHAEQPLADVRSQISNSPYALPVVDQAGTYLGMVSRAELLSGKRPKVILVDHFEAHQAVRGLEQAEIIEILDHHRIGNLETQLPLRVDCRPLGSTATIVAQRFQALNLNPTQNEATLLLGALISDTLALNSPTTTETDRTIATRLAQLAQVDLESFGKEVLIQSDATRTAEPHDLVNRDLKEFGLGKVRFSVSQVETVDRTTLEEAKILALADTLTTVREQRKLDLACLLITDVFRQDSLVLIDDPNSNRRMRLMNDGSLKSELWEGCVSRKKQFLPALLSRLAEL